MAASAGCAAWLRDRFGDVDAARHCAAGLRGRDASAALNARLRSALPDVDVVDAFALTDGRCEENLPGDAMHFHGLLYDELTLVLEAWAGGRRRGRWAARARGAAGTHHLRRGGRPRRSTSSRRRGELGVRVEAGEHIVPTP